ncbi:MAG: ATP-binding protein [Dehalococcoidia bacterium]
MKKRPGKSLDAAELRRRAEKQLKEKQVETGQSVAEADLRRLYHELEVHQIELEMQNEELRHAQAEIEAGLEKYTDLYDFAPTGYFTLAGDGTILAVNLTGASLLGIERARLMNRRFGFLVSETDRPAFNAFLEKTFTGKVREFCEVVLLIEGTSPLFVSIEAVVSDNGQECRAAVTDISERKRAEQEIASLQEQFLQSQKMEAIGRLAGGIAHDFNNLLTIIQGHAQLSILRLREGDPLRENIERIERASERATALTHQLLAFSRRQIMEMMVLDLNQILQRVDRMLRRVIGEDIELETFLSEPIGKVKTDQGQIEQVIMNIAVNARDAMPDGGKLIIETANVELDEEYARAHIAVNPGRYVMISLSDTGVGMTPEVRERIFEPFFTTKEKGKGTGLGLSTVYGIVRQSGGNICVYSEHGKGTTFNIYLPQVDEPLEELKKDVFQEIAGGGETILVVEDEETVRELAVMVLERQGYRVLDASGGKEALLLCGEFKDSIHLLLTDVVMPGMGGHKLVDFLKEIHPETKALYMSGYTDNAILHHGVLDEGIEFIQKPFTVEKLARKVREVLDK